MCTVTNSVSHQRRCLTRSRPEPAAVLLGSARLEHHGVDLTDGLQRLLNLRFADDLLLFSTTAENAATQLGDICAPLV